MPIVRLQLSVSLDGFVAGPRQSLEDPIGEGGMALHEWAFATKTFRTMFGTEGGETGLDEDRAAASRANLGATIMGRNMFGPIRGEWADDDWKGWWGDNPPFHTPVYVLTHHARDPLEMGGGTTFHFVTDGIEAALELARAAAGEQDVQIGGGASTAGQYLRAGLVDELELHVAPVVLGSGERLLEDLGDGLAGLEPVDVVSSPRVAHFRFVRNKRSA